jgi:threonine/homoserine/homoserine lactone efflux protein
MLGDIVRATLTMGVLAATPGPGVANVIGIAARHGFGRGLSFAAGVVAADMMFALVGLFGLAPLMLHHPGLFALLRFGAAAYMLWLTLKLWAIEYEPAPEAEGPGPRGGSFTTAIWGFFLTCANPSAIAAYVGVLPGLVGRVPPLNALLLLLLLVTFATGLPLLVYSYMAVRAGAALRRRGKIRIARRVASLAVCACAMTFLIPLRT